MSMFNQLVFLREMNSKRKIHWSPDIHKYFPTKVQEKIVFIYWCLKQSSGNLYTPKEIIFRMFNHISIPYNEFTESKKLHKLLECIDNNIPIKCLINPYTCDWWYYRMHILGH